MPDKICLDEFADLATCLTFIVYVVLAFIACRALKQVGELKKQNVIQSYSMLYEVLLSEEMSKVRTFVLKLKPDLTSLQELPKDDAFLARCRDLFTDRGRIESTPLGTREVERLLTAFNNVGLLFQQGVLSCESLPAAAQRNVKFYWSLLGGYVKARRDQPGNSSYGIHFQYWAERSDRYWKEATDKYERACKKVPADVS